MPWVGEHLLRLSGLYHSSLIHNAYPVTQKFHHSQIMGYEEEGEPVLPLQMPE